jgi:hypothetical protein
MRRPPPHPEAEYELVAGLISLKTIAEAWDVDRSTARRLLRAAGVTPVVLGRGRNGSIRYRRDEVEQWILSRRRAP